MFKDLPNFSKNEVECVKACLHFISSNFTDYVLFAWDYVLSNVVYDLFISICNKCIMVLFLA